MLKKVKKELHFEEQVRDEAEDIAKQPHPHIGDISRIIFPLVQERKATPASLLVAEPEIEGRWVHNKDSDICMICEKSFGIFRYRHHCRKCGRLVCDSCSDHKRAIPSLGQKERRVCDTCKTIIDSENEEKKKKKSEPNAPPLYNLN